MYHIKKLVLNNPQITTKKSTQYILTIMLSISLLTACNTIPQPLSGIMTVQPNININEPYVIIDNNTISTKNQPSIAIQRWEVFYSDPKLKELIKIGLHNNRDLKSALLNMQATKTQFQIAEKAIIPTLGSDASVSRQANHRTNRSPSQNYTVNLGMSNYEIDMWGRVASIKEKTLNEYLQTTAGKDSAQISLISNIAQLYINYSYAKAHQELASLTVKSREHSLFITQKRFEAGVDPKTPSLQAASSLESAKLALYDAETNIIKVRNALQAVLGSPIPAELIPDGRITKITNQDTLQAGLPSNLLLYRPDILQAEYNLHASGANVSAARASFFPKITLTSQAGLSSSSLKNLFSTSNLGWSFTPTISLPIFDAGQLDANYSTALIKQESALVNYEKSIQNAFREVNDVLADRVTIHKKIQSQYNLQRNFDETYAIAHARYKSGLSDYLSVLDAQRSLFASQQRILQLEQKEIISQVQLYQVLGGGIAMDTPVELSVPNTNRLVRFITNTKLDNVSTSPETQEIKTH